MIRDDRLFQIKAFKYNKFYTLPMVDDFTSSINCITFHKMYEIYLCILAKLKKVNTKQIQ